MEFQRHLGDRLCEARQALGAYVGAQADDLVYVTNITMGLNVVAHSIPLQPGDEVLGTDHEYGAMERAWEFNCQKNGARYVRQTVPLPVGSAEEIVEAVWSGVTERTRVLFFSHITSPTAFILPAAELIRRAREAGILTVVDGAHAAGQVALDLEGLGVDFYSANCHKWMMAPKGSGFLYARREVQHLLEPLVVSWGWGNETTRVSRFVDVQQNQGTRDLAACLAVPTAIAFMREHQWPHVQRSCHELLGYARRRLSGLTGLAPLTPDGQAWYGQMASLPLPSLDGAVLHRRLIEEYDVEVPICRWNGHTMVRVSVQGYNTRGDIDALMDGLATLLPQLAE
jgi:isopenicillin-N epimerase